MEEDPSRFYRISIGTDSELSRADKRADLVTAVVVHRVGCGARYFWRSVNHGPFHTLRDRMIREVLVSLDSARDLLACIAENQKNRPGFPKWAFEVHADVGEEGPTHSMLQEVVAMIRANNFIARTKPLSYAASSAADRHTG
jgi:predicted RNase H-related nuclease YkuK (DUF458 family)